MNIWTKVIYRGKKYEIFHIYDSGYCEIREIVNPFHVECVLVSELVKVK
ncbi:hypothetical protein [Metabacillus idriensis]|nr:hypothetical protein [Metabacillus idriensis]